MGNSDDRPATILLVEDIDWIRASMKSSLKREGYLVAEATNDTEALEVVEREPIELVLTEEKLPTFQSLLARLREHPVFSLLPIAIINPDADEGARCEDAYLLTDYTRIAALLPSLRP